MLMMNFPHSSAACLGSASLIARADPAINFTNCDCGNGLNTVPFGSVILPKPGFDGSIS